MTLVEAMVVVAVIGILAAVAAPDVQQFFRNQRLRSAARSVADALLLARAEAIRTGNRHVVFFSAAAAGNPPATDPAGNSLGIDPSTGGAWPVLVLDDGAPAASNCVIDANEPQRPIAAQRDVAWGFAISGGVRAPGDVVAGGDPATGTTFVDRLGVQRTWVMFGPDGIPVSFTAACAAGAIGSGAGAVYLTNGTRDYAVVLSALGGVRVHNYEGGTARWSD